MSWTFCVVICTTFALQDHPPGSSPRIILQDHPPGDSSRIILPEHPPGSSSRSILQGHPPGASSQIILPDHPPGASSSSILPDRPPRASSRGASSRSILQDRSPFNTKRSTWVTFGIVRVLGPVCLFEHAIRSPPDQTRMESARSHSKRVLKLVLHTAPFIITRFHSLSGVTFSGLVFHIFSNHIKKGRGGEGGDYWPT